MTFVALAALAIHAAGPSRAADPLRQRAEVRLEVGARTGAEIRWEFNVLIDVRDRLDGDPIRNLTIAATGFMDAPGHHMQTVRTFASHESGGRYRARMAFYMPGTWRIRVVIDGASVSPRNTSFAVRLR